MPCGTGMPGCASWASAWMIRTNLAQVRNVAAGLSFPVGLLANSSAPGYGRIWRLPVSFTIDRAGRLAEDGWRLKQPSWTPEHLAEVVTPLLQG
jgi:hypothetical protein